MRKEDGLPVGCEGERVARCRGDCCGQCIARAMYIAILGGQVSIASVHQVNCQRLFSSRKVEVAKSYVCVMLFGSMWW